MHQRYGFELIENEPDMKTFRTTCSCQQPEDDCWIELTIDEDLDELYMTFWIEAYPTRVYQMYMLKPIKRFFQKLKFCWDIMRGKSVKFESSFIFRGRNHVEDFCDMIYLLGKQVRQETNELKQCKDEVKRLKNREKV